MIQSSHRNAYRVIAFLVITSLLLTTGSAGIAAAPGIPAVATSNDVVWASVDLDGHVYEFHAVLKSPDASLPGRALSLAQDQSNLEDLYVLYHGQVYRGAEAEQALLLAQAVREIDAELRDAQQWDYIDSDYVGMVDRVPSNAHVSCTSSAYRVWVPDQTPDWWRESFLYHGETHRSGIDCDSKRASFWADVLFRLAVQPDFYNDVSNDQGLVATFDRVLGQTVEKGSPWLGATLKLTNAAIEMPITQAQLREIVGSEALNKVLAGAPIADYLNATTTLVAKGAKYSREAARLQLLTLATDARAKRRLQAIEYWIGQNRTSLDGALVQAVDQGLARDRFAEVDRMIARDWPKAIEAIVENPADTYFDSLAIAKVLLTTLRVALGTAATTAATTAAIAAASTVLFQITASYQLYTWIGDKEEEAVRASLTATLQRQMWSLAAPLNLQTFAHDVAVASTIDGERARDVVELFKIHSYAAWEFYQFDEKLFGSFATSLWVKGILGYGAQYDEFLGGLRNRLAGARDRHEDVLARQMQATTGSDNAWLIGLLNTTCHGGCSGPQAFLVSPLQTGDQLSGSVKLHAVTEGPAGISYVDFQVWDAGGSLVSGWFDVLPPYEADWDTTGVPNGRYTVQAVAYDNLGRAGPSSRTILVYNEPPNDRPKIRLSSPNGESAYDRATIRWTDEDIDDDARTSFYRDTDNSGYDGTLIVRGLHEDWTPNTYSWYFHEQVPVGTYWIYAEIDDGHNPVVRDYAPGPLHVVIPEVRDSVAVQGFETTEEEGDGDGVLDVGEKMALKVQLRNTSAERRYRIRSRLLTDHADVEIMDESVSYSSLAAGEESGGAGNFNFIPHGWLDTTIPFTIEVFYDDAGGATYRDFETLTLQVQEDDKTPPAITSTPTAGSLNPDSVIISWDTDEFSDSTVDYGTTPAYGLSSLQPEFIRSHSMLLRGLLPGTTYYYRVGSTDESGNESVHATGSFTTPNLGAGLHVVETQYPYLGVTFGLARNPANGTLWMLERLESHTYQIVTYDPMARTVLARFDIGFMSQADNNARGLAYDGTYLWVADKTDEVIYKITTSGTRVGRYTWPGDDPNGLAWDGSALWVADNGTDEICRTNASVQPVTCFPSPGPSPADMGWDGTYLWVPDNVTNLLYQLSTTGARIAEYPLYGTVVRALTEGASDRLWASVDPDVQEEMLALIEKVEDTTSPVIAPAPIAISEVGSSARISWGTDEPATGTVEYGPTASYGQVVANTTYAMTRTVPLSTLTPGATYHYRVGSQDLPGNAAAHSPDLTFSTASATGLNVVNSFSMITEGEYDLAWDGVNLCVVGRSPSRIYKLDPVTGALRSYINIRDGHSQGLTWDGTTFWVAYNDLDRIYRINPTTGSTLKSIPSPAGYPRGLAWDGDYLWVVDSGSPVDRIYQVNPSSGAVGGSFAAPGPGPAGLTYANGFLWISTGEPDQRIYKVNRSGTVLATYPALDFHVYGLTWDGSHLWQNASYLQMAYQQDPALWPGPVIARVDSQQLDSGGTGELYATGSIVRVTVTEQYARTGFTGAITITSATADPGIAAQPLTDNGDGTYSFDWNTAGQLAADDYRVETSLSDGVYADADGLSVTPDLTIGLQPGLRIRATYPIQRSDSNSIMAGLTWANGAPWVLEVNHYPEQFHRVNLADGSREVSCQVSPSGVDTINPNDITWDGAYFWITDSGSTAQITRHSTACKVVHSFSPPGADPQGITWDGAYLWFVDRDNQRIYKYSTSGGQQTSFPSPGPYPRGLAWDGTYLWNYDASQSILYKLTTAGTVVACYPIVGLRMIRWDGSRLWATNGSDQLLELEWAPDLALALLAVSDDNPQETDTVAITATVHASSFAVPGSVLRFYLGDPQLGGIQIGADHNLGTVSPGTPVQVSLPWSSDTAGVYPIYAVVDPANAVQEFNEANNTVFANIYVYDADIEPPIIGDINASDSGGDGDGHLEDNEPILFTWMARDDGSMLASTTITIAGTTIPGTAGTAADSFSASMGPLGAGVYTYTVTATDADNTPEAANVTGQIAVVAHAPIVVGTWPPDAAQNVDTGAEIQAVFDAEMEVTTGDMITDTVRLSDSDGIPLWGTVSYSPESKTASLQAYELLEPGATYTITVPVTEGVTDELENPVEAAVVSTFTTAPDTEAPLLELQSPAPGQVIGGFADIFGTIIDPTLEHYALEYGTGASSPVSWTEIITGSLTSQVNSVLGVWDTTAVSDGVYTLRLRGEDRFGNAATVSYAVTVFNPPLVPRILRVTPNLVNRGEATRMLISGERFAHGGQVRLNAIPVSQTEWIDSTKIGVDVPTSLPPGTYNITVDNGAGRSVTLASAFTVLPVSAPVSDLKASHVGANFVLDWIHTDTDTDRYQVWRSLDPYFAPGSATAELVVELDPPLSGDPVHFSDSSGGVGSTAVNYFYVVRLVYWTDTWYDVDLRMGDFDYSLRPGE